MDWILLESVTSNTMTVSIVIRKSEVCRGTFWVRNFSNPKTKRQLLFILTSLILKAYQYILPSRLFFPPSFSKKKNSISETTLRHVSVVTVPSSSRWNQVIGQKASVSEEQSAEWFESQVYQVSGCASLMSEELAVISSPWALVVADIGGLYCL